MQIYLKPKVYFKKLSYKHFRRKIVNYYLSFEVEKDLLRKKSNRNYQLNEYPKVLKTEHDKEFYKYILMQI